MSKLKNNLDEMQEQKLLSIEHNGLWFAFWGLLVVILIQIVMGGENTLRLMGVFVLSFIALAACASIYKKRVKKLEEYSGSDLDDVH